MKFISTRGAPEALSFSAAMARGPAPDGGLFTPERWPTLSLDSFDGAQSLTDVAGRLLSPFLEGDALAQDLAAILADAFDFAAPLIEIDAARALSVLELFHGPTAAFKDFGAKFLAASLARARKGAERPLRILVATSGDTGGAVAAAFHNRPGFEVVVLFPKGLVSPTQQHQLTCWGGNVRAFAVRGTFDDCQRLVKAAFADKRWRERTDLTSANSINLGRLLPQMTYFASASLSLFRTHNMPVSFVIPSGNLGHATACAWARQVGMPIGEIVLAHNANRTMPDFLETGEWRPRVSIATIASAMDVGDPSNAERLRHLFPGKEALSHAVSADAVEDAAIRTRIRAGFEAYGQIWCPHTATGMEALERLAAAGRMRGPWVVAATAHPAKFVEIVEPLIGRQVERPLALARLFERPASFTEIDPRLDALAEGLDS